ncbi:MAG: hypothetical protein IJP34_03000 [Clostridia bacterium]|nr:hypothetical protein [Clostridia bacterium]
MRCKRILALCIIFTISMLSFTGCGNTDTKGNAVKADVSTADDSDWEQVFENVVLENDRIKFVLNSKTTHFTVTDKLSNRVASSVASGEIQYASEQISAKMNSEVSIVYYSEQSDAYYMYSQTDSVAIENYKILTDGEAVRVYYTMGEKDNFVPEAFDEQSFEELLEQFEDNLIVRRFKRYYTYYSPDDSPEDIADVVDKYPFIKKKAGYIANENLTEIDCADISSYLDSIGYTQSKYKTVADKLGIESTNTSTNPGYTIPLEYSLTNEGFNVKVLTDKIVERTDEYKLQSIEVLPFFDSSLEENGSYFVADGSGALFDYNSGQQQAVFSCYGNDYSLRTEKLDAFEQNTVMPVYGSTVSGGGFFAEITEGSEVAEITVSPYSISSPLNHIYTTFVMRNIDVNDYSDMDIPIYNLFQKKLANTVPTIEYCMLTAENNKYSDMAEIYRKRLIERGELKPDNSKSDPVYIDYLCMITEEESMMGIPYSKKTVLSTLGEITASVEKMINSGIGPIVVRLIGYSDNGYEHEVYSDFNLSKKVGTKEQLLALKALLNENGGQLYLDTDMLFAYKGGNGFTPSTDTARYLNRLQNLRSSYDIVTHKYDLDFGNRYFISPSLYDKFSDSLISSVHKEFGSDNLPGFSYGTTGMYLGADYNKNCRIDRVESGSLVNKTLKKVNDKGVSMMFDVGNGYVLKYADHILNLPSVSSQTDAQSQSVPFVQMVMHSYINYAGGPYNLSENPQNSILNTIGYSSCLYASFITRSDSLITESDYKSVWRSLSDTDRIDDFIKNALALKKVHSKINTSKMIKYSLEGNVSRTVYDNGCTVYVNYGASDATVDGNIIKAHDYLVKG